MAAFLNIIIIVSLLDALLAFDSFQGRIQDSHHTYLQILMEAETLQDNFCSSHKPKTHSVQWKEGGSWIDICKSNSRYFRGIERHWRIVSTHSVELLFVYPVKISLVITTKK